ncbi:glycoside hydrolase family 3 protein [Brachybacterium hainanense]|uniref:Glycoside hydrolase family 3 protein n=1 Tax=Brachybacterium hainanense TaxID=1541174 RepID=A0ABV6RBI0_9MICO
MPTTHSSIATARLPLPVKVGQVNQRLKGWEAVRWVDGAPQVTDVLRAEVDRFGGIGALYGVLRADPWSEVRWHTGIPPERSVEAYAAVQDCVMSRGEGLPVLFVEEAPHGLMALGGTTLPVNLALGATMDADLARELGEAVAAEARERGTHLLLVSGLDVLRDPRWGRAEECFGEDPAIAAMLVEATVRGMQAAAPGEPIDESHVAVVAKHLAGQGAGIGGRNGSGAPIGRRELGEIHLRPAFAAARAGVAGFMSAYNDVDGVPCTGSRELLTDTLREEWGWDGIVMSDGGAIDLLARATGGLPEAAALALSAGVDLSLWDRSYTLLEDVIGAGLVPEPLLDQAASRVLALKERLGLLGATSDAAGTDRTAPADGAAAAAPTWPSDRSRMTVHLAHEAARRAVVVLSGEDILPLNARKVAVVGPNADALHSQLGDYAPPRPAEDPPAATVREALVERLGALQVSCARGSDLRSALVPVELDAGWKDAADPVAEVAAALPLTAVTALAQNAEAAIVVLGGTSRRTYEDEFADNGAAAGPAADTTNGEGVDLAQVALPEAQLDVARAAKEAGRPVIAVVIDGRPRVLADLMGIADAVLLAPFGGPSSGRAIVEALYGPADASATPVRGVLPVTLPAADGVWPVAQDERLDAARYTDHPQVRGPLLGTGLPSGVGVALVSAAPAELSRTDLADGASVQVTVRITSSLPGPVDVPVIVFGRRREPGIVPRTRMVLAARRTVVEPGASELVLDLGLDALGSWASGSPHAVPAQVEVWTQPELAPPTDAHRIRVTA